MLSALHIAHRAYHVSSGSKISFAAFAKLRPKGIKLARHTPHNVRVTNVKTVNSCHEKSVHQMFMVFQILPMKLLKQQFVSQWLYNVVKLRCQDCNVPRDHVRIAAFSHYWKSSKGLTQRN